MSVDRCLISHYPCGDTFGTGLFAASRAQFVQTTVEISHTYDIVIDAKESVNSFAWLSAQPRWTCGDMRLREPAVMWALAMQMLPHVSTQGTAGQTQTTRSSTHDSHVHFLVLASKDRGLSQYPRAPPYNHELPLLVCRYFLC